MKRLNSLELKDKQAQLFTRCKEIVETCKAEVREMTEEEEKEFNENQEEIKQLKSQLDVLKEKLAAYEDSLIAEDDKAEERKYNTKNNVNKMKENLSIVKEIRTAMENGTKQFRINADVEKRNGEITVAAEGEDVVEKEIQGILEPLYANSVLSKLGVKWYTGMPMGDIAVPVMASGNVGWADEIAAAGASTASFSSVVLQPKRLTAYVDISKKLLAQDTIGVENAIRRDIVNALNDKLEATVFGSAAGTTTKPAGIFYDQTLADATSFAKICEIEAGVESNNVFGDMKYLLSPGAKADLRAMAKSSKNTQLVYEGGEVDGVPAFTTSNVATAGAYVYGNFSNLAIGSWGDIDITVDEYTQAVNGCVRLVINAYFDAKILRPAAFAFGKTRA